MNTEKRYKIAMISTRDIRQPETLSGTGYFMAEAIDEYIGEVEIIPLLPSKPTFQYCLTHLKTVLCVIRQKLLSWFWKFRGSRYRWDSTVGMSKHYAKIIESVLAHKNYECIFADKGSAVVAHLNTSIPVVYGSDCTFSLMMDYYHTYTNLSQSSKEQGNMLERMAIQRADACLFRSEWAARSAIEEYGADPAKVVVSLFGPNIHKKYIPEKIFPEERLAQESCTLLLIGVEWYRKGCDIAVETTRLLRKSGVNARLTICGCVIPSHVSIPDFVSIIPFINKKKPEDMRKLVDLYNRTAFFLLPTRAEAFGIVNVEASAFGIPVIASNTGGVKSVVQHNQSGYLVDQIEDPYQYAQAVREIYLDRQRYIRYANEARRFYEEKANWKAWAGRLREAIEISITHNMERK